ncbi:MAG: hypothetical protein K8R68_07175, partial [Bacteroidales bacterium]|nr:hypothetical protein [Bacteroidales bacterium]
NNLLSSFNAPQRLILQPLKDIHFKSSHIINNRTQVGDMNNIVLFTSIGLLILISSIINYVILASSKLMEKIKDLAVHKVYGASRGNIISFVMSESMIIALMSFPFAIFLSELFLPFAKDLLRNDFTIFHFNNWEYLLGIFVLTIIVGLTSGAYTVFISAKITPIESIVKKQTTRYKIIFQKGLIILQLGIFTGLIMFTLVIKKQLNYCLNYDMGFNNKSILNIDVYNKITYDQYLAFTNEVNKIPGIAECAFGSDIPSPDVNFGSAQHYSIPDEMIPIEYIFASSGYLEICNIELISGRYFDKNRNEKGNILINESAVKSLGIIDPIGKIVDGKIVIGIVKDFILHSLYTEIPPIIVFNNAENKLSTVLISFESGVDKNTVEKINVIWDNIVSSKPFEASSFESIYEKMYEKDIRMKRAISIFSILAVIISCLGVFGMTHFTIRQRTKEIGIRKVNGAGINDIIYLIHKQAFIPFIISILLSIPTTYILSLMWLDNFAYYTSISVWEGIISSIVSFIVFSFPIIVQSYHASTVNPVHSLNLNT